MNVNGLNIPIERWILEKLFKIQKHDPAICTRQEHILGQNTHTGWK